MSGFGDRIPWGHMRGPSWTAVILLGLVALIARLVTL